MHKEYILLNGFRKAKRGFTAGFHVPLSASVESRKLFLDVSLCLQGVGHGVGVSGHLLGGSDLRWRQPFGVCGEGLSPPVHTSRVLG